MKALSIKQPWASLIVHGIKDIEKQKAEHEVFLKRRRERKSGNLTDEF